MTRWDRIWKIVVRRGSATARLRTLADDCATTAIVSDAATAEVQPSRTYGLSLTSSSCRKCGMNARSAWTAAGMSARRRIPKRHPVLSEPRAIMSGSLARVGE
jgi:hypothetical protein